MKHLLTSTTNHISAILSALVTATSLLFNSCNGQEVKTNSSKHDVVTNTTIAGQPKMSRGLLQDKSGNFWFGAANGITCYDGKQFIRYTEKDGLSNNHVGTIMEDNTGKLWFGTADGITCYDDKKFTVIPVTTITGNTNYHKTVTDPTYGIDRPMENFVLSILQDSKGIVWVGTPVGIFLHDPSKDHLTSSKIFSPFSFNDSITIQGGALGVESIIEDSSGNIWFGGRGIAGVHCYNGKSLTHFTPDGEDWLSPMLQDKLGNIYFTRRGRTIYRYDGNNFNRFGEGEFNDFFFCMEQDSAGNLWFGNGKNGGVTFYDGKSFINYTAKDGLFDELMGKILKAKDGSIWFSNKNNQLFRFDGKTFTTVSEQK